MTSTHKPQIEPITVGALAASKLLGLSERSIAELVSRDEIPSIKLGGRRLFSVEALKAWIAAKVEAAKSEATS
jgi:excisionase family DNA binding protein